jgi:hypothetical protein
MPDLSFEEFERHLQERAALVRAEVAEEIACELETSGFDSQMDADFAARIARQHATT